MIDNYTKFIEDRLDSIERGDFDSEDISELDNIMTEYTRSFSDGLNGLLLRTGFDGDINNTKEKNKYFYANLHKIGKENNDSTKHTFRNWINGKEIPGQDSREAIFELCFALSASLETVQWFFNHVYFYRAFNCHDIKEAIYYYCFKNNYDYFFAQSLIQDINNYPITTDVITDNNPYTWEIREDINEFKSIDELKSYFRINRHFFTGYYNQKAKEVISHYVDEIKGTPEARETVEYILKSTGYTDNNNDTDNNKKKNPPTQFKEHRIETCGLIVYEKFAYIHENILDESNLDDIEIEKIVSDIKNVDLSSMEFMIDNIYSSSICVDDLKNLLPAKIAQNFPSAKILSNLLNSTIAKNNINTSVNYDSIRKCLILLKFYHFWCNEKLGNEKCLYDGFDPYEVYLYETNDMLLDCGYDDLFAGNMYDRLFIYCAKQNDPLSTFRKFISRTEISTQN